MRLYHSPYSKKFIFKGGMCLSKYLSIGRETKDLDFLIKGINGDAQNLQKVVSEIATLNINDGFTFESVKVSPLAHRHMKYPGFELAMMVIIGATRSHVRIDVGIGDQVTPENLTLILSVNDGVPLFEKDIELWAYSAEAIFAEKYETAIRRGATNSRMKDYHDLILLIQSGILDLAKMQSTLTTTFKNRKTAYESIPDFFGSDIERLENYWRAHLRTITTKEIRSNLPTTFNEGKNFINAWMKQFSF